MDFRLAIITLPEFFSGETDCIARLSEAGAEYLHLRKPGCSETQMRDLIERIPPRYRRRLIVHRHFGLAKEYGLKGIHLSSSHESIPEGFEGMTIGRSCHTVEEASRFGKICDYVFLSPIFDSISKQGYRSAFSLEKLSVAFRDGSLGKNVMGGSNALSCANMALAGYDKVIPLDETIAAMYDIGTKLPPELRCTYGGLGKAPTAAKIAERLARAAK